MSHSVVRGRFAMLGGVPRVPLLRQGLNTASFTYRFGCAPTAAVGSSSCCYRIHGHDATLCAWPALGTGGAYLITVVDARWFFGSCRMCGSES